MLRIISHIERLLLMHDCVIVPGFGGFVSQSVPAIWKKEEQLFIPPRKEIGFNETLRHSDGLLAESYMQLYNVDYNKAQQMLDDDVEDMKKDLNQYNKLSMGVIGTITLGAEEQILFTPSGTRLFSVSSYGLSDLHMLPVASLQPAEQKKEEEKEARHPVKKDTLYIPVSRKLVRFVASTAAAIAIFLMISTPIAEVNKDSYKASFIPYEMVKPTTSSVTTAPSTKKMETSLKKESPIVSKKKSQTVKSVNPAATSASIGNSTHKKTVAKKEAKPVPIPKATATNAKMYHVVIASFPDKEQADTYMKTIDRKMFASAAVIARNNKYRVYANRFTNRKEANDYLLSLHKNKKYKDAWLFISR